MNYESKIPNLWMLIAIGLFLHSFMYLLPLFYGESVAVLNPRENGLTYLTWLILICILLPMMMVLILQISQRPSVLWINFALSLPFLLLNVGHPFENLAVDQVAWDQVLLQIFIAISSIVLTLFSFRWARDSRNTRAVKG